MFALLFILLCDAASGLRIPQVKRQISKISTDDVHLDDLERELELKAAQTFEPSKELTAAWKTALQHTSKLDLKNKQFAHASLSVANISAECKDNIRHALQTNPACADPWDKTSLCQHAYEIPSYRLGDLFYESSNPKETASYMKFFFPHSVAAKYLNACSRKSDMPALLHIVDSPEYAAYERPSPKAVIVHLRLGDVLYKNKPGYMHNDGYYQRHATKMVKEGLTSVVLVTGDHRILQKAALDMDGAAGQLNSSTTQTEKRTQKIENMFKEHGLTVTKRINYNADCDLVYMANARTFVESGGGYSRLVSALVKLKGGSVWA